MIIDTIITINAIITVNDGINGMNGEFMGCTHITTEMTYLMGWMGSMGLMVDQWDYWW